MNRTDLARSLIRYRFTRNGMNMGCTPGEAAVIAESQMKAQGLFGFFSKVKVIATPEGSLVSMVESYLTTFISELKLRPEYINDNETPASKQWSEHCLDVAARAVEQHRNRFRPGIPDYPKRLHDYVFYRMNLEISRHLHIDPADMGLDEEAIFYMTEEAKKILQPAIISRLQ